VQDEFENWYIDGDRMFRIILYNRAGANAMLRCQQRYHPAGGGSSIDSCQQSSVGGYVVFTDLSLDTTVLDYYFRLDFADQAPGEAFTEDFDVYSPEDFVATAEPPHAASSACLLTPQPIFRVPGVRDLNPIIQFNQIPVYGAVARATIVICMRTFLIFWCSAKEGAW